MAFVSTGLPNSGRTPHLQIAYDDSSRDGRHRASALLEMCEDDYELIARWFRPIDLSINPVSVGIGTYAPTGDAVSRGLLAICASPHATPARIRYLFVAEVSKLFMRAQDRGWLDAEGHGQGLSLARFLGAQALAANALGAPDLDLQPSNAWMESAREDYVNGPGESEIADGCRVLFLYYLMMQLKFGVDQIVGAAAPTVADVYRTLAGKSDDPFPTFKGLLESRYPGTRTIPDHPDNPWPIGHLADDLVDDDEVPPIDWGIGRFVRP
jgi:hypothetical protein